MLGWLRIRLRDWLLGSAAVPAPVERKRAWTVSDEAVGASRRPIAAFDPFKVADNLHPKGAAPSMAMDEACGGYSAWAASAISGVLEEGQAFLGYPVLAELAQRPEYRRIVETIARHMTREWIELEAVGDEDKSEKLAVIERRLTELKARARFRKAAEHDGFFGRGHIYIDTGDTDNPDELKVSIGNGRNDATKAKLGGSKKVKALRCVEAVWCYPTSYNSSNPLAADWYKPATWFVMGTEVHASRLLTFVGREVPDLLKPAYSFGGLAMTQMAKPYVDNWLRTRQSVADIISAFSTFVLKTKLGDALMASTTALFKRATLFNNVRDNRGLMIIDKEDEDFANVSAPLGSLDHLQAQSQEHMAAVSGIPLVELLGITPSGLNASSDGEIKTFHGAIHAGQEHLFRDHLTTLIDMIQVEQFGEVDPDITFKFKPLDTLNAKELSEKQNRDAQTDTAYVEAGVVDAVEVRRRLANDPSSPYQGLDPDDAPLPPPGEDDEPPAIGEEGQEPEWGVGGDEDWRAELARLGLDSDEQPRDADGKFATSGQIVAHVSKVIGSKGNAPPLELGPVSGKNADLVRGHTGVDISGHRRVMETSDIRHALKEHGDPTREEGRGQKALKKADFALIPHIVENAHKVDAIGDLKGRKGLRLGYEAKVGDHTYHYVEHVRPDNKIVALKTMRKG